MTKDSKTSMANLQNEEQTHILDAIDEMRDLGVNEDISIPQVSFFFTLNDDGRH